MNSLRLSLFCLLLAFATGGLSLLPETSSLTLPEVWESAMRGLCIAALVGFAVLFMAGLARTLQRGDRAASMGGGPRRS